MELWPLIFLRQLHVTELTLDRPQIDLLQSAAGGWNFSSLGGKSAAAAKPTAPPSEGFNLSVKLVEIANGRLTFAAQNGKAQTRVLENVNVELDGFSANARFPFKLTAKLAGGGDVQLNGTAGPINSANAVQTPAKVTVKLSGFNLAAAGVEHSTGLAGLLSNRWRRLVQRQRCLPERAIEGRAVEAGRERIARARARGVRFCAGARSAQTRGSAAARRNPHRRRAGQSHRKLRGAG